MADPTVITAFVGTAVGVIGAATPILLERRHRRDQEKDRETEAAGEFATATVANWTALNDALNREISRLHSDIDRIRTEYQAAMDRQRADYEAQLAAAHEQIAELRAEVATLRRLLRPDTPP